MPRDTEQRVAYFQDPGGEWNGMKKRMSNTFSGGDALRNAWGETPGAVPWPLSYIPRTDFTIEKGCLVTISYSKSGGYALKWLK